ncbi:carboxymuconolactone decarboxylase family protein [Paraburkholderia sp. BL21I4N1]|uniref:carboxymuconolactone decarboxylase family protein n=1 Tax=Paraburkholderia sp. BL21I4N1 TaxID=1938801 RepID=UPI000CFAD3B4|nr:carboxymuconolactone decarboxylase family protein [Paraburkholderia sp. BL21I4N1]PQV54609.1 AhpD family alkylhydroperoxidase [Paraburkholderia sp. BL21I4N1]
MSTFQVHTLSSAPEQSRPVLQQLQQTFGFIPNIAGAMAESPVLIGAFINLFQKVHSGTFTEAQIQTLLLTNAVTNACSWAVAFHTALALHEGLTPDDVEAIRAGRAPADRRHAALSTLAKTAIEKRGHLDEQHVSAFLEADFSRDQVLELLAVTAASTITNYVGSITQPPLESQFQVHAWHA